MDSNKNFLLSIGSDLEHQFEPKLADGILMEPTSSSLMYQDFPLKELSREQASLNPFSGVPQLSEPYGPLETSSTNSYLKNLATFASRPLILIGGNESGHGALSMEFLNFPSNASPALTESRHGSLNMEFPNFPSKASPPLTKSGHGSLSMEFLNFSSKAPPPLTGETPTIDPLNFHVLGSDIGTPEHASGISSVENGNHEKSDAWKKKKKKIMMTKKKMSEGYGKEELIKGQWNLEEDRLLTRLVKQHGERRWSRVAQMLPGRVGKQCRDRWQNHLRPDIKKSAWSEAEDKILIALHKEMGNKWSEISRRLPGRSENTIKNHWNATKRRQMSSRNNAKAAKRNTLLQDYIRRIMSSSSTNDQIDTQTEAIFSANPNLQTASEETDHKPVISAVSDVSSPVSSPSQQFNLISMLGGDMTGSQDYTFSSMLGVETPSGGSGSGSGSVLDGSNVLPDHVQLDLTTQLAFDVKKEMDFWNMLYQ